MSRYSGIFKRPDFEQIKTEKIETERHVSWPGMKYSPLYNITVTLNLQLQSEL